MKPTPCEHEWFTVGQMLFDGTFADHPQKGQCRKCGEWKKPTPEEKCTCITPPSILCPVHGNSPSPEARPNCGEELCDECNPSPEARVDWELKLIEGLLWYALDPDFHDNKPLQGVEHFMKYKAEFDDKDSPWYKREHMGDCTQEPNSCATCQIEQIEQEARILSAAFEKGREAR
jgi:hypothetical protein